jgi:hypothetical protein
MDVVVGRGNALRLEDAENEIDGAGNKTRPVTIGHVTYVTPALLVKSNLFTFSRRVLVLLLHWHDNVEYTRAT